MNLEEAKKVLLEYPDDDQTRNRSPLYAFAKGVIEGHAAGMKEAMESEAVKRLLKAFDQLANPPVRHQCEHGILLNPVWLQGAQEELNSYRKALEEGK